MGEIIQFPHRRDREREYEEAARERADTLLAQTWSNDEIEKRFSHHSVGKLSYWEILHVLRYVPEQSSVMTPFRGRIRKDIDDLTGARATEVEALAGRAHYILFTLTKIPLDDKYTSLAEIACANAEIQEVAESDIYRTLLILSHHHGEEFFPIYAQMQIMLAEHAEDLGLRNE